MAFYLLPTYLTDGVRSIPRDSAHIGCEKRDRLAAGASSVVRPSCSPSHPRDCTLHWDLHAEKRLLVE